MISVIIVTGKIFIASACNPSNSITEIRYLGTVRLLQPKTKQSPGECGLPVPDCPQPRFRAQDLHALLQSAK